MRLRGRPPPPAVPAGSMRAAAGMRKLRRPATVGIERYRLVRTVPINPNSGNAVMSAAGTATVRVGPQGLGTRWYPTMAAVQSSIGAADTSSAAVYAGPLSLPTVQGATSYAGGGDTAGLNNAELYPGLYVIAVWSGGTPGSVVTLTVYGDMTALITDVYAP